MQIAIPEIDGATEPFVFGGLREGGDEPEPRDWCIRSARRIARWNRLRLLPRSEVRLAVLIYCFPPDKGNLGTAAGLDVFPSLLTVLSRLRSEGYTTEVPATSDSLRELLLSGAGGSDLAHVAYRLPAAEYFKLCPYVHEIEAVWGPTPGRINSQGLEDPHPRRPSRQYLHRIAAHVRVRGRSHAAADGRAPRHTTVLWAYTHTSTKYSARMP